MIKEIIFLTKNDDNPNDNPTDVAFFDYIQDFIVIVPEEKFHELGDPEHILIFIRAATEDGKAL